ncbi:MAG TPA: isoprenylcysteine carboxylmethyltransferase family protein [Thermoanaerobaculia bacterium]|jgi:protein-S-isoprenylcysteine O-methyltransferase Ste14|nr:isoprenylcysteine carboxylmethyltransferase family protein [Thermoanaerobaculia bacterium]
MDDNQLHPTAAARALQIFVVLRGLIYSFGFVVLWAWLAVSVRPYDSRLSFGIPVRLRLVGWVLASAGALLAALCIGTFVTKGRGTPAPFDPPREFVASGPYRYVRNPMYIGAAGVILGSGLILSSPSIVLLAFAFLVLTHLLVVLYEEPALTSKFGDSYLRYKSSVHRWLIRRPRPAGFTG